MDRVIDIYDRGFDPVVFIDNLAWRLGAYVVIDC